MMLTRDNLAKKRILTVSDAAKYSGYSRGWIEYWIREGLLPFESPPSQGEGKHNRKFIRRADLDAFLDSCYQRPQPQNKNGRREAQTDKVTLLPRS